MSGCSSVPGKIWRASSGERLNLYGKQWVDGRDRKQIERLARYITRPPIAQERLTRRADGTQFLEFKKAWKDGSFGLVLQPEDLLVRLCAAVPPPRFHMVRYFGVLLQVQHAEIAAYHALGDLPEADDWLTHRFA